MWWCGDVIIWHCNNTCPALSTQSLCSIDLIICKDWVIWKCQHAGNSNITVGDLQIVTRVLNIIDFNLKCHIVFKVLLYSRSTLLQPWFYSHVTLFFETEWLWPATISPNNLIQWSMEGGGGLALFSPSNHSKEFPEWVWSGVEYYTYRVGVVWSWVGLLLFILTEWVWSRVEYYTCRVGVVWSIVLYLQSGCGLEYSTILTEWVWSGV